MRFPSAIVSVLAITACFSLSPADAVNFVIIQPDDLHYYEDWSPPPYLPWSDRDGYPGETYPGTSRLPWINALRSSGLHLTSAYAASPKCGTSRYTTLTGRYASRSSEGRNKALRSGVADPSDASIGNTKLRDVPDVPDGDDCSRGNLAQVFRGNGYATGMVGKWHLSKTKNLGNTVEDVKEEIRSCGFDDVEAMYPDNFQNFRDWARRDVDHNMEYVAYKAVEFIEEHAGTDDFFLYVNPTAPHAPNVLDAMAKDCRITVDGDFRSTMDAGWSVEGMTAEYGDDCFAYRESVKARAGGSTSDHALGSIWVDDAVGAIYKALERTGQLDDTVILFQLDHGKAGKDEIWEGGVKIPQFVHYPNGLGTEARSWDGLVSTIDVGPTFLDFAGIDAGDPHRYPMDGLSWKDALDDVDGRGDRWRANRCLFFESSQERSVRCGCDKYMLLSGDSPERRTASRSGWPGWDADTAEALFDLCDASGAYADADPSIVSPEATNLIASEPQKASAMAELMRCHLAKTSALVDPLYEECAMDAPPTPAPIAGADTAPPEVQSFTPAAGASIMASITTFHVWASDASSIRNVKFQLQDPSGNVGSFEDGILVEDASPDYEKWASASVTFDSTGQWLWRAKVTDDSASRNQMVTPWIDVRVVEPTSSPTAPPTSSSTPEPTPMPAPLPTPAPVPLSTPEPTSPPQPIDPPRDDTTPPIVQSFTPDSGTSTSASSLRLHVWAFDDSPIRNVKFQLQDPTGNVGTFDNGFLVEDARPAFEKWASPVFALNSVGQWLWRAKLTDNSDARNQFTTPWLDFVVVEGDDTSAQEAIDSIKESIEQIINDNPVLRPKFLRLGFHDCVGGCDGCVNMSNGDNAGLDIPINALVPVVAQYAHNPELTASIGTPISRADIWALATLVGAEMSTPNPPADVTWPMTHIGRVDCSDANAAGEGGFDHELPSPNLNTHELLAFFAENFGFNSDETVAIMGAHSIGGADRANSGFNGPHGWVNNPNVLANGYYDMIIGGNVEPDNFWDLIHAPQWTQEVIDNSALDTPSRIQWFHEKDPNRSPTGQLEKIIMLNADIALVRDLSDHMEDLTTAAGEIISGSVTSCGFRCSGTERLTGCPDRDPPLCPHAAATFDKATDYAFDNDLFLRDFQAVLGKMLKNGYDDDDLVEVTGNAAAS